MLGLMFQKVLSKKWMFLCLLLGSVLLVATMVSFPMYQNAVFDRMLRDEFQGRLSENGEWPARLDMEAGSGWMTYEAIYEAEDIVENIGQRLGVETKEEVIVYSSAQSADLADGRIDALTNGMDAVWMSDLEEHVDMLAGEMYSERGLREDGRYEAVISRELMLKRNLMAGDVLLLTSTRDAHSSAMEVVITGVFEKKEEDHYWDVASERLSDIFLMPEAAFRELFMKDASDKTNVINCNYYYFFEYETLEARQVPGLMEKIAESGFDDSGCLQLMEEFLEKSARISATLFLLQMPVLFLLGAFLLMVSRQMYELERNEISVIKSRGSSGFQIFRLYLYQSIFIAAAGVLLGVPLSVFFVRVLGSARNFLEFGLKRKLEISFEGQVWWYLAASVAVMLLLMTLPAIGHSRVSIVNLKQGRAIKKRAWWERFFLDFVCLATGLYGYYHYFRNQAVLMEDVLKGQSLDPLLYISTALFIVGMGLFFLRLQPLIVKLIYSAGKRFWHPAAYASFVESLKNGRKQQFIMLFLILTVSLGIFYATVARTILQNALNNVEYLDGADVVIREVWKDNVARAAVGAAHGLTETPRYYEPDVKKYMYLGAESYTKVLYDDPGSSTPRGHAYVKFEGSSQDITLMGIHTREFGQNTWLDRELLEEHYYTYLNALADEPDGILVSRSFQTWQGCEIGSELTYYYDSVMGADQETKVNRYEIKGKIVGFVDYWPGFDPVSIYYDSAGEVVTEENYLVVGNIGTIEACFEGMKEPYEMWITLKDGTEPSDVTEWIGEYDVSVEKYVNRQTDIERVREDPLLQGTNGILTMGFLVMILLCAVGYLIYWIMSVRSRELAFGTLRAFGMHKGELFQMLILEQFFSSVLSVFAGIGIGKLASGMFVPMLQLALAASNQALPMLLYTRQEDMVRLYSAVALVMTICVAVLILLVFRLNMTKALKLGEE